MREDGDFLKDLRAEIAATQKERASYIRAKLTFVVSLLGFGSTSISNIQTDSLLYLAPLVAYVFDLYILATDFGVKRAGTFLRLSTEAPKEELLWERAVRKNRDPFSSIAGPLSSSLVLIAATVGLWISHNTVAFYWSWLVFNVLTIGGVWGYGLVLIRRLKKFEAFLVKEKDSNRVAKDA